MKLRITLILTILIFFIMSKNSFAPFYDVISFDENNTWNIHGDPDLDTIYVFSGDCIDVPLYIHYIDFEAMYTFEALFYADSNTAVSGISLEETIFGDRFSELAYFFHDSTLNSYYTVVSDSIFDPPYYTDSLVHIAYNIELNMNGGGSYIAGLGVRNVIIIDPGGTQINIDLAGLIIIVDELGYERGDLNHDSLLTEDDLFLFLLTEDDLFLLLQYIYMGGQPPSPMSLGDVNCDCVIDIEDVLELRNLIY